MNGADLVCDALLANGVDTWFANPGTSEMHLVAALDRRPEIRCILGLSEGVVTGAADGYGRMMDRPAATLLHCGPGLANGLANLHNARRARTPMINLVGDHATYHLQFDAPLTSDIESLARPMSHWVGRVAGVDTVHDMIGKAYRSAMSPPGVSTLIFPADVAWTEAVSASPAPQRIFLPQVSRDAVREAALALRSGKRVMLILSGNALREGPLVAASAICAQTGAQMMAGVANSRIERGSGRADISCLPYPIDVALGALGHVETLICIGYPDPVSFFAYPGMPGRLRPEESRLLDVTPNSEDPAGAIMALAEELGIIPAVAQTAYRVPDIPMDGALTGSAVAVVIARLMPEGAIVCNEAITQAVEFPALSKDAAPHDMLQLTGGAIGIGMPLACGAAIACPDRKVIGLQADGSGMYTCQALWTQARERLDVVTVILANRSYSVLHLEMRNVGVGNIGANALKMLNLDDPVLDWVSLARGMGVEGARADSVSGFADLMESALRRKGPFLIEAVLG